MSEAAKIPATQEEIDAHPHEELKIEAIPEQAGYVFVYVSNENKQNMTAYFDDLRLDHAYANLSYAADYFPFGTPLPGREIEREPTRYKNSGEHSEYDEETGLNSFEKRMMLADFVRWAIPDPARQYASPYVVMGNNPISQVDPDGGWDKYFDAETGELVHDTGSGNNAYIAHYDEDGNLLMGKGFVGFISDMENDMRSLIFDDVLADNISFAATESEKFASYDVYGKNKAFKSMVQTGSKGDLKNLPNSPFNEIDNPDFAIWNNRLMRPDDWGNYNFAAMGRAFGFSRGWLIFGAGVAQVMQGFEWKQKAYHGSALGNYPSSISYLGFSPKIRDIHWSNFLGFFDGPRDTASIIAGFNY